MFSQTIRRSNLFFMHVRRRAAKKNFMAPFYGLGSTASRLEPLRGGTLLFTTKSPETPGTNFY